MGWDELLGRSTVERGGLQSTLSAIAPAQYCQSFFLLGATGVLGAAVMPREARSLLADYGARKATRDGQTETQTRTETQTQTLGQRQKQSWFVSLVATATSWGQVPHSWFTAFYALSLGCSVFWLVQYLADGAILRLVASSQADMSGPSATLVQVAVVWTMMFLQAGRRIYEHATIIQPSKSTMWFVHWALGLAFYFFVGISIWVEGSGAILDADITQSATRSSLFKISFAIPIFLYAWLNQYRCHAHLAGLKKYSLPQAGLFCHLVCPHYTCECLLYLSLALAAAPEGQLYNETLLCAVVFVVANLGVTALGTRHWYAEKFGDAAIVQKWNMIPFVF